MTVVSAAYVNYRRPPTCSYAGSGGLASGPFHTLTTTVSMGAASAARRAVVFCNADNANLDGYDGTTTCLVNGVSLSIVDIDTAGSHYFLVFAGLVTSGDGSLSIQLNRAGGNGFQDVFYSAFAVRDALSNTPVVYSSDLRSGSFGPYSDSIALPFGGVVCAASFNTSGSFGFGGILAKDDEVTAGSTHIGSGHASKQLNAGTRAGTYTVSASGSSFDYIYAAFA